MRVKEMIVRVKNEQEIKKTLDEMGSCKKDSSLRWVDKMKDLYEEYILVKKEDSCYRMVKQNLFFHEDWLLIVK